MSNLSETFCYFPFVHANIRANKNRQVSPCWRSDETLGHLNDRTLPDIWAGDEYRELRRKFLEGEKPEGCSRCFRLEEENKEANLSLRSWYLENYAKYKDDILKDPYNPKLRSIELRFSNLCNYSCLHCGSQHSTSWNQKLKSFDNKLSKFQEITTQDPRIIDEDEINKMLPLFDTVDEVRITGGEPLTDPVFYYFLEAINPDVAKNIELLIVSNLSSLKYEDYDAMVLFEKFKEVKLRVSIDADEASYFYFRSGGDIEVVKENIARIQAYENNISISGVCAVNSLNITRLDNIVRFHEDRNMFFKVMFVQERPHHLDIRNLPREMKDSITSELQSKIPGYNAHNQEEIERVINYMNASKQQTQHWVDLKEYVTLIDELNETAFIETYPEFRDYWYD
jgi:MoaA/NifB/PqqE/SkfB family radical SAM enzyme